MTQYAQATGTRIAYDTVGEGPDIVFLHAGIANREMWEPQLEALSDRYRCTALDIRGFGESEIGAEAFSRRDDLAAVLDAIGADTATIVGCSIGAGFSLDFAIERPERVDKLVLIGVHPAGFEFDDQFDAGIYEKVEAAIEAGDFDEAARLEAIVWLDGPNRPEGTAPQWLRDKVKAWSLPIYAVEDWGDSIRLDPLANERLHEVKAPTLVIVGEDDTEGVKAGCRRAADAISGARLVTLPNTAHLPNLEVPEEFNRVLVEFLDS